MNNVLPENIVLTTFDEINLQSLLVSSN